MPERLRYGPRRANIIDLTRPGTAPGPAPVVVALHGGYWRAQYTLRLMRPLADALARRGWAVANVEYRRVGLAGGRGGWPATFEDVADAVDHLGGVAGLDLGRVVTVGHSAGGHLALWLAARHRLDSGAPGADPVVRPAAAVSLAGVVDLVEADRLGLGAGAVAALLGGHAEAHPQRYGQASPAALLPIGVPQVLLHGDADGIVPLSLSASYVTRATALGDDARLVALPGVDHMAVIRPSGPAWSALCDALDQLG